MKKIYFPFLTIILLLNICGCKKENYRIGDKLIGEWNIDVYKRSQIKADGTETVTQDEKNAGYWRFFRDESISSKHIVEYETKYTGTPNYSMQGSIFVSEEGKRFIFPNFYCTNPIGCDMVYTVQEFSDKRMVLELYTPNGITPPNNSGRLVPGNNPNSEQVVNKLRMELSKK